MTGLRVERARDGAHLRLVLDRAKGNIVSGTVLEALQAALPSAGPNGGLKLITLEAAGADFSYGASVGEHTADRVAGMLSALNGVVLDLLRAPAPTLALVQGRCLGGAFELVLACDLVFASEEARLGVPEVALGVFPPAAAALLPWRVGASRAARAVIGGEALPARWWAEAGLVDRLVATGRLQAAADEWFDERLAPRSAAALAYAAEAARAAMVRAMPARLADLERLYLTGLLQTHDATEGIAAFIERRTPRWRHA